MPLNFLAAHSSRVTKRSQHKNPVLKRSISSPFTEFTRRKPVQCSQSKPERPENDEDFFGDCLDDIGPVKSLAPDLSLKDVTQTLQYIRSYMFDTLPDNRGFSSTRTAEILNFRRSLPPTITSSHVHALTQSPTATEREVSELTKAGTVRRTVIPGRGTGGSSIAEGLVISRDIERLLWEAEELGQDLIDKFLGAIRAQPMALTISPRAFTVSEITDLMRAGFLTSTTHFLNSANVFARPVSASLGAVTSISNISKAGSGSVAAVGGDDAIYEAGGRGGIRRSSLQFGNQSEWEFQQSLSEGEELKISLPGTGPYLKLLTTARSHLVSLIMKSKFREMPLYLLHKRWDGGISGDDPVAKAKKYRGEFTGILPSQTRKWKQFYGLSFDWVLAECLGAGLVEVFETGSVGRGVRIP